MKGHLDAAERQKSAGEPGLASGKLTFGQVTETCRRQFRASEVRPNTKAYREAGVKLVFRSWDGIAELSVRRINCMGIDPTRTIRLRAAKNEEQRMVPMTAEMRRLVARMEEERADAGPDSRALLVKEAQGFITSACKKLGILRFTTHFLRHLFGTACLEGDGDVRTVANWLGHEDNGALLLKVFFQVRQGMPRPRGRAHDHERQAG